MSLLAIDLLDRPDKMAKRIKVAVVERDLKMAGRQVATAIFGAAHLANRVGDDAALRKSTIRAVRDCEEEWEDG